MKTKRLLFLIVLSWAFTACANLTEEIHIEPDGSGKIEYYSDMIPSIMAMQEKMSTMFKDSTGASSTSKEEMEAKIWEDFPEVVDSTIDYTDKVPEKIKSNPEQMKMLEKMRGYMRGGRSLGYMNMGVEYPFDDFAELQKFTEFVEEAAGENEQSNAMLNWEEAKGETTYEMNAKKVKRTFKLLKKANIPDESMAFLDMMFQGGKYHTIVHLPRNVKKVKGKNVKSIEGKKVVFEYGMKELMLGEVNHSFEIIMKKK